MAVLVDIFIIAFFAVILHWEPNTGALMYSIVRVATDATPHVTAIIITNVQPFHQSLAATRAPGTTTGTWSPGRHLDHWHHLVAM